jgi:hypothetical protein
VACSSLSKPQRYVGKGQEEQHRHWPCGEANDPENNRQHKAKRHCETHKVHLERELEPNPMRKSRATLLSQHSLEQISFEQFPPRIIHQNLRKTRPWIWRPLSKSFILLEFDSSFGCGDDVFVRKTVFNRQLLRLARFAEAILDPHANYWNRAVLAQELRNGSA